MLFKIFLLCSSLVYATGYTYVNSLRAKAGIYPFSQEVHLEDAAQHHSYYMHLNTVTTHNENSANAGYTGAAPSDRVVQTGYFSKTISENVSGGTAAVEHSIDGLFAAIYHRFGFLTLSYDQLGVGIDDVYYTYDMGNAALNDYCENGTYAGGSYYTHICEDTEKKISVDDYNTAVNSHKDAAPEFTLWPPVDGEDIPPVFYEETPDPLPSHSVTGYPVSVAFNDRKYMEPPAVSSFMLKDSSNTALETIIQMDHANDPNGRFTPYQYALFPKKRLEWGSRYTAILTYDDQGTENTKTWCFATRSLYAEADKVYRIENQPDVVLQAVSGRSYAIYVVPADSNNTLGSVHYSYTGNIPDISYIDSNTVKITMTGSTGNWAQFTFDNGQKVKLTLAENDTAAVPKQMSCALSEPDYIPTLNAQGTIVSGASGALDILVRIGEFNGGENNEGNLSFTMIKNANLSIDFNT